MDWKSIVKSVAPMLGTALGGPMAGAATKFIAEKFLGKSDATESEISEAVLGASPEQLLQIKKLDVDFRTRMRELDVDVFKMEVADRSSARDLAKVDMRPHIALSAIYTTGYFVMVYLFMTGKVQIDAGLKTEFSIVLGVMTAAQTMIMQFWFGSSSGSKSKDATPARP